MIALAYLTLLALPSFGFRFDLPARKHRCFTDELVAGKEVTFSYVAEEGYAQFIDVKITDPNNAVIWEETGKDRGSHIFIVSSEGDYAICFYSRMVAGTKYKSDMKRTIAFYYKSGSNADDYQNLATKEQLKPLEVSLRMMEDSVRSISGEYRYIRDKEWEMSETSEHMFARALWLTIAVMGIILLFSLWQVRHLKLFFKKKRLID